MKPKSNARTTFADRNAKQYVKAFGPFYGDLWFRSNVPYADAALVHDRIKAGDTLQPGRAFASLM